MGLARKGTLILHTLKYLKPTQLINQVIVRLRPKEKFWKYATRVTGVKNIPLWIDGLDNDLVFVRRFKPECLLDNRLLLLGEARDFDGWSFPDASHLWNFNVHYLEYLVPLFSLWKASGDNVYRKKIDTILEDWYERGSREPDSNQAYTISLRVVNQLVVAEAVRDKKRLYHSIYAQYRYLIRHQERHLLGNHYLENLKAIVICSIVFQEETVYRIYVKKLLKELEEEIADDGIHFELSLMYHKIVLEDLIRVAVVLRHECRKEYESIAGYIAKMCTALSSLETGIGRTLLFNDAGDNVAKPTDALLGSCERLFGVEPQTLDQISGYHRLSDGLMTLIVDCGKLSPAYMPGHSHCDCMSFELFYNGRPIFVNSGTYQYQGVYRNYFRSTSAHNTLLVNGHEQSELWGEHRAGRRIQGVRSVRKNEGVSGEYKNYLGERHSRTILLNDGALSVLDETEGAADSYLHLAPGLRYSDGIISGNGIELEVLPLNAQISLERAKYSPSFGEFFENECLVFSWNNDGKEHGYRIEIKSVITH